MKRFCCWTLSGALHLEWMLLISMPLPDKGQGRRAKTALTGYPESTARQCQVSTWNMMEWRNILFL